jgi:glyoxylase-like metal-dependent hydrolase (beta-lactamase superfamily II)
MKIHVLHTGFFKLDGGAMFGVVPKSIWNKLNPADENNLCNWAMRCLLVDDGNRRIVIDAGIGDKQDEKFFRHYYLSHTKHIRELVKEKGYPPDSITDVFLTHLHFDHCGGAIIKEGDKFMPSFPNATYWSNQEHWEWATKPNEREKASFLKENILPIEESGKLQFISNHQGVLFTPDISVRFVNGHTGAMMLPQIKYNGRTLVYMADLLPSVGHIPIPYVMAYDMFPLTTLQEKKQFVEEASANNYILFFEHDPVVECCELQVTEKGIRSGRLLRLEEL